MTERDRKKDRENKGKMKKLCRLALICFTVIMLAACGSSAGGDDEEIQIVEAEPLDRSGQEADGASKEQAKDGRPEDEDLNGSPEADKNAGGPENGSGVEASGGAPGAENTGTGETAEQEAGADPWVGEYNDYDVNEPNLEIQKNEDGSYEIHIGVFRLLSLNDGHGVLTERGMEFTTSFSGEETTGVITLDGDIATVTFDPGGWPGFYNVYSYRYYKTSDTPDMELFAY